MRWTDPQTRPHGKNVTGYLVVLAVVGLSVTGCRNASSPASSSTTFDTLPRGIVVVHNSGSGAWDSTSAWKIVVSARIAPVDLVDKIAFAKVDAIEADAAGRLYVADFERHAVHVFDSAGHFVRDMGREGKGPGEFQRPMAMAWDSHNRLLVFDPILQRVSLFDTAGHAVAHFRAVFFGNTTTNVVDSSGRYVRLAYTWAPSGGGMMRLWTAVRYDSLYRPVDSAASLPGVTLEQFGGPSGASALIPFTGSAVPALTRKPSFWTGVTTAYRFYNLGWKGDTIRIVERSGVAPVPVGPSDLDTALASPQMAFFVKSGGKVDSSRIPKVKPQFVTLIVDDSGDLWVERSVARDQGTVWDVFDPTGRYLGEVVSPVSLARASDGPAPIIRGNHIYALTADAEGSPTIVLAHVVRPGS